MVGRKAAGLVGYWAVQLVGVLAKGSEKMKALMLVQRQDAGSAEKTVYMMAGNSVRP